MHQYESQVEQAEYTKDVGTHCVQRVIMMRVARVKDATGALQFVFKCVEYFTKQYAKAKCYFGSKEANAVTGVKASEDEGATTKFGRGYTVEFLYLSVVAHVDRDIRVCVIRRVDQGVQIEYHGYHWQRQNGRRRGNWGGDN